MPLPPFGRLSQTWHDRSGDAFVRQFVADAERYAARMDRIYPGVDWLTICMDGLYRAAYSYEPARGAFHYWMYTNIASAVSAHRDTWKRRRAKFPNRIGLAIAAELRPYYDVHLIDA